MLSLRTLLRHPIQFALMTIGIALGVAVMVGIDLANASAERAFDLSASAVTGRATHSIIASGGAVDETLYVRLRTDPAWRGQFESAPVVRALVVSPQLGEIPFTLLGIDPFAEGPFRAYLGGGQAFDFNVIAPLLTRPGAILLSAPTAARYGLTPCLAEPDDSCRIDLTIEGETRPSFLAGLIEPADDFSRRALDTLILTDLATAQSLTGMRGELTQIDLILPLGYDSAALEATLPPGSLLTASATRTDQVNTMTAAFRINLTALSLLALVVGIFLIYNTMTFSVVQRRALFGTLRSLGYTREQVFGMVLGEAALVGALGAGLGLGLGVLLGQGAVQMVTQTINDLFFVVSVRGVQIPAASLLKGGLAGLLASLLAAAPPAWEAASVPPRLALSRAGLESKADGAVNLAALLGILAALLGIGILAIPTRDLVVSFTGTFAVIVGLAAATPFVTVTLMRLLNQPLGALFGLLGRLAPRNVIRSQSRTAVAVAALMVAVSVTIGVQVMIASFRTTVTLWLDQTLQGDIYIAAQGLSATRLDTPLDPQAVEISRAHPLAQSSAIVRVVSVETRFGPVDLVAATPDPLFDARILLEGESREVVRKMEEGGILLSEPLAARLGITSLDEPFQILTPQGWLSFPVAGIYADYASTRGTLRMDIETYRALWDDPAINGVSLNLLPGADVDAVTAELRERLVGFERVQVNPSGALRNDALQIFDRTFAITNAMQLVTTLVAFIGVLSSLLALQLEKAREMGILRALGLTVAEMRRLTFLETGLLGASAGALALPTGYILAWILIYIINQRSFGWTLQMQAEPLPFLQAFALAVISALLAGVYPAIRLSRIQAAEALRGE
jgi:putative ABC transport system permease protein